MKIDSVLRTIGQEEREDELIALVQILPSSGAKNEAIMALGRYGTVRAYSEVRRELLRPAWTKDVDFLYIARLVQPTSREDAFKMRVKWIERGVPERQRQACAIKAMILLTGHVPSTPFDLLDHSKAQQIAKEFDQVVRKDGRLDRKILLRRKVKALFFLITNEKEKPFRVSWAIWLLSQYSGSPTTKQSIDGYVSYTPVNERIRQWEFIRNSLQDEVRWDCDRGEAIGLSGVSHWLFINVGLRLLSLVGD